MKNQLLGTLCLGGLSMMGLLFWEPPVRAAEVSVQITSNLTFKPADVTINKGDTIKWTGDRRPTHQLKTGPGPGDHGDPITGDFKGEATHQFPPPGSGQYHCIYHPSMVGTITVK